MTDQPVPPADELEPEDLLPEDVEGTPDPVTLQPNPTDDLRVWQQKVAMNSTDRPPRDPDSR